MKKIFIYIIIFLFVENSNAQLSWMQLPDYPGVGRLGIIGMEINGRGYLGFGLDVNHHGTSDWWEYVPGTNTWVQRASLPVVGRWSPAFFSIGDKGYICTGAVTSGLTSETWEYDQSNDSWTLKTAFPGGVRENAAAFSINGKGYVGTGYASSNTFNDFYEFDPVNNSWTTKANFPGPSRSGSVGFVIGSKGYIGMGNATNSVNNFKDFYEYDPVGNSWIQKADFPIPYVVTPTPYSGTSSGFTLCGYYYQYSGITHNPMNMFYKYDPVADQWTLSGTFPGYPRGYAGGFALGNDIYFGSGAQNNTASATSMLNDFWKLANGLTLIAKNDIEENVDFLIYPNPASDHINIPNFIFDKKVKSIRIYNSIGKMVYSNLLKKDNEQLSLSSFSRDLYFVELVTKDGKVYDSRFIKE